METRRLDVNALEVATFEVGGTVEPEAGLGNLTGATGVCNTCRPTVCQETRAEV